MLETIKEALFVIVDFVSNIIDFVIDWIGHAITFSLSLVQVIASYPKWLEFIPSPLVIAIIPVITMTIGLRIVNRS